MSEYTCPNGHPFPRALPVPCPDCGAQTVCEPVTAGMRLHEALEVEEARCARLREEVAQLRASRDDWERKYLRLREAGGG